MVTQPDRHRVQLQLQLQLQRLRRPDRSAKPVDPPAAPLKGAATATARPPRRRVGPVLVPGPAPVLLPVLVQVLVLVLVPVLVLVLMLMLVLVLVLLTALVLLPVLALALVLLMALVLLPSRRRCWSTSILPGDSRRARFRGTTTWPSRRLTPAGGHSRAHQGPIR